MAPFCKNVLVDPKWSKKRKYNQRDAERENRSEK